MSRDADIKLLFGVLGGGNPSGESGALIQSELSSIVNKLNQSTKDRKIKIGLNKSLTQSELSKGLKQIIGTMSSDNKFTIPVIKVGKIDATSAINEVKKELAAMLKNLSVSSGVDITGLQDFANSATKRESKSSNATEEKIREAAEQTAELNTQLKMLDAAASSVQKTLNSASTGKNMLPNVAEVTELTNRLDELRNRIETIRITKRPASDEEYKELLREAQEIQRVITLRQQEQEAARKAAAEAEREAKRTANANKEKYASLTQVVNLYKQIERYLANNKQLAGTTRYKEIEQLRDRLLAIATTAENSGNKLQAMNKIDFEKLKNDFFGLRIGVDEFGNRAETAADKMSRMVMAFGGAALISRAIRKIVNELREMVSTVVSVDAAMTELKKVTDETDRTYDRFLTNAVERAKDVGATVVDTVNATADFARLGHGIADASALADAALVYKNVGDGIADVTAASESIISTMQAFKVEAQDAMSIVDKFNITGNNFAISSAGVGEALLRSASAMAAAGNTLDETIALAAAANEIVQNPESVGTSLKTISMFLRAAEADLENAGESTEGMANSVAELREQILALTGQRVDIMVDGDPSTFKSTYQILKELSTVIDSLADTDKAALLELIGGKRNANITSALLQNFETAEAVVNKTSNAAGSALAENEKYLESINGKIAIFKAAVEDLATTLIDSGLLGDIIDFGTDAIELLTKIVDKVGGMPSLIGAIGISLNAILASRTGMGGLADLFVRRSAATNGVSELTDEVDKFTRSANNGAGAAVKFGASLKSFAINAGVTLAITAVISLINNYVQKQREAREALISTGQEAVAHSETILGLASEYASLTGQQNANAESAKAMKSARDSLRESLGYEISDVEELIKKYGSLEKAVMGATLEQMRIDHADILTGVSTQGEKSLDELNGSLAEQAWNLNTDFEQLYLMGEGAKEAAEALVEAGMITSGMVGAESGSILLPVVKTLDDAIERYKIVQNALDVLHESGIEDITSNGAWTKLSAEKKRLSSSLSPYFDMIDSANENLAGQIILLKQYQEGTPQTVEEYAAFEQDVISQLWKHDDFIKTGVTSVESIVSSVARQNTALSELKQKYDDSEMRLADLNSKRTQIARKLAQNELRASMATKDGDIDGLHKDENQEWVEEWLKQRDEDFGAMLDGYEDEDIERLYEALQAGEIHTWADVIRLTADKDAEAVVHAEYGTESLKKQIAYLEERKRLVQQGFGFAEGSSSGGMNQTTAIIPSVLNELQFINEAINESYNQIYKLTETDIRAWINELMTVEDADSAMYKLRESIEGLAKAGDGINADSIRKLALESEELNNILMMDGMSAEYLANVMLSMIEGRDCIKLVSKEALRLNDALLEMEEAYNKVTTARSEYQHAMEVEEKDTAFKEYAEAWAKLNEEIKAGRTNSNAFWASAEFLYGAEQLEAWGYSADKVIESNKELKSVYKDADSAGLGMLQHLYELAEAGELLDEAGQPLIEISKAADGGFNFKFDTKDIAELARRAGVAEEALAACVLAWDTLGDVSHIDYDHLIEVLEQNGVMAETTEGMVVDVATMREHLEVIGYSAKDIFEIMEMLRGQEGLILFDQNAGIDEILDGLTQLGIVLSSTDGTQLDLGKFLLLQTVLNNTKEDAKEFVDRLSEVEGLSFRNAAGEIVEFKDAMSAIDDSDFIKVEDDGIDELTNQTNDLNDAAKDAEDSVNRLEDGIDSVNNSSLSRVQSAFEKLGGKVRAVYGDVVDLLGVMDKPASSQVQSYHVTGGAGGHHGNTTMDAIAFGTKGAKGGESLVGERGPELVQSGREAYLVGLNGPEIVDLNRGDMVFNAQDTKKILSTAGRGKRISGSIPAYEEGIGTTSGSNIGADVTITLNTSNMEDQLKETLDKMADELAKIIQDYEHSIFLTEKNGGSADSIIAMYRKMQDEAHALAEEYRSMGLQENSDYIQELQQQWWSYEEAIQQVRQQDFDARLENRKFVIESLQQDGGSTAEIVGSWKGVLRDIQSEIEYYSGLGYDESSEVIQNLIRQSWDAEEQIAEAMKSGIEKLSSEIDGLQDVYETLCDAADEYAESGFISIDALQSIIGLGVEYMALLQDENGMLVLNEEAIQRVVAARAEQMAVESALSYIEELRLASENNNIEAMNRLLTATISTTGATWGLVYANLELLKSEGKLTGAQYSQALKNINAMRALAESATKNIQYSMSDRYKEQMEEQLDYYKEQEEALEDILDLVMDMIEQEVENHIDALEDQIDKYQEIINLKKESLDMTKEEDDYQDEVADRIKEISDLQTRIDKLRLDGTREAMAEAAKLEEELAEKQESLADYQADHHLEVQKDSLDKEAEAFEETKNQEIAEQEKLISSTEKLYQLALERINAGWDALYDDLISYNYEYGNMIESDLVAAWNAASAAVQEYGSYLQAVSSIKANIEQLENSKDQYGSSGDRYLGEVGDYDTSYTGSDMVSAIVAQMKSYSKQWSANNPKHVNDELHSKVQDLARQLRTEYGVDAQYDAPTGTWTIVRDELNPEYVGRLLYDCYHSGGIVGNDPTLKDNEVLAVLENDEMVLDAKKKSSLYQLVDMVTNLADRMKKLDGFKNVWADSGRSIAEMADGGVSGNTITNENIVFNPAININIQHHGEMTEADARRYGKIASNTALEELSKAFDMRGIGRIGSAALKA